MIMCCGSAHRHDRDGQITRTSAVPALNNAHGQRGAIDSALNPGRCKAQGQQGLRIRPLVLWKLCSIRSAGCVHAMGTAFGGVQRRWQSGAIARDAGGSLVHAGQLSDRTPPHARLPTRVGRASCCGIDIDAALEDVKEDHRFSLRPRGTPNQKNGGPRCGPIPKTKFTGTTLPPLRVRRRHFDSPSNTRCRMHGPDSEAR